MGLILLELCFIVSDMKVIPIMNITGQMPYQKHSRKAPKLRRTEANSPWARYGSDESFLAFLRLQGSILDGATPCIAAHVRRAAHAGTAFKPPYSAVSLTWEQHNEQSWRGEAACLNRYIPKVGMWNNLEAKEYFDKMALQCLKAWSMSTGKPLHWME